MIPAAQEPPQGPCLDLVLAYRPRGSTSRWRKTAYQAPPQFAEVLLAQAQAGTMVGLTAPIVIAPSLDHTTTEFCLLPATR